MQKFSQKYVLIQLLEEVSEGQQFSANDWPLHSTVVDVFAIDWDVPTMIKNLRELLSTYEPAISVAEDDTFFGPEKQMASLNCTLTLWQCLNAAT